jgi:hypothetical protein
MFDPNTVLDVAVRIKHPVTGTQVFVAPGVSFGAAITNFDSTTLGYSTEGQTMSYEPDAVAVATFSNEELAQLEAGNVTKLIDPQTGKEMSLDEYRAQVR